MSSAFRHRGLVALAAAILTLGACESNGAAAREPTSSPARRLVGIWDVRLRLDRPVQLLSAEPKSELRGTLALIENTGGRVSYPELPVALHYGAYAIDFRRFGFDAMDRGRVPTVVGRTDRDSVALVLASGTGERSVFLFGRYHGDSITGLWSVVSRAAGGGGRFVMRKRS